MDKDFAPEPEHLLTFIRRLKEVFDVCDDDSDGLICPEQLVRLGSRFGHREQVRKTNFLDFSENVQVRGSSGF